MDADRLLFLQFFGDQNQLLRHSEVKNKSWRPEKSIYVYEGNIAISNVYDFQQLTDTTLLL